MSARPTHEEIERCVTLLETLVEDPSTAPEMDPVLRRRLMMAAGRFSHPARHELKRVAKAFRRADRKRVRDEDRATIATAEIRTARNAEVFVPPPELVGDARADEFPRELRTARKCYVCKDDYTRVHFFYDAMCPPCATRNYAKRFQTADLTGKVALITGARIKIGFQSALMMLRAGARVLVTTRFPRDAASRFARENDYAAWKERLDVYGLDLRHSPSVETFARYLVQTESRLDILINNAAQTVRRPPAFYRPLLDLEQRPFDSLPPEIADVLRSHEHVKKMLADNGRAELTAGERAGFVAWSGGEGPGMGIRASAELSQLPCSYDDTSRDAEMFPAGRADADLQQIDLRTMNSWRMTLADVPSPEMLEVQLVNAVAPFILCAKLKPLILRTPRTPDAVRVKHIVNVSAMEGKFARHTKTDKHPHTNMAKASLNMLTLTSAPDYAKDGIFMNAVDTGWVTDEDPVFLSQRKQEDHDFQPPLDIVDGAARVCDPFFSGMLTGRHVWGKFLKDYDPTEW